MSSTLRYALLITVLLLLVSIPLAMQRDTGGIEGLVTNESGPIAKASIEARNVMSGAIFRTQSDAAGRYKLNGLPEGRYSLWVTAARHDSVWIRQVIVEGGRTIHHDIRLGEAPPSTSSIHSGSADQFADRPWRK